MAEAAHGFEGSVEYLTADGVVDDVEAAAARMLCNISRDGGIAIDEGRAKAFDGGALRCRAGREHFCPERARDLDCHGPNAACAAMDQHVLSGLQRRAVDQSFP